MRSITREDVAVINQQVDEVFCYASWELEILQDYGYYLKVLNKTDRKEIKVYVYELVRIEDELRKILNEATN